MTEKPIDMSLAWALAGIRAIVGGIVSFPVATTVHWDPQAYQADPVPFGLYETILVDNHPARPNSPVPKDTYEDYTAGYGGHVPPPKDTNPPVPKDGNPKTIYGQAKPSPSVVPPGAILECSMAMAEGSRKYGKTNWRDDPVSFSTYYDACQRHLMQALDGEDRCPKSGALHVAHAMANCAIILDAMACGTLIDDRPTKGATSKLIDSYTKEIAPNG